MNMISIFMTQFYLMFRHGNEINPESTKNKFLDRFEGRTSTIGKAGLLSLLEQNRQSLSPRLSNEESRKLQGYQDTKMEVKKIEQNTRMGGLGMIPLGNSSRYSQEERDKRASHQSFRSDMPRRNSLEHLEVNKQRSSIPKLPQIGRQSNIGMGFQMRSSVELKPDNKYSLVKSKESVQHLQFLNKFEERLKKMENQEGKTKKYC